MIEAGQPEQAESARHRSTLEFRRLLEKLPAAAYTCDAEGLITYYNSRAVELWGREPKLNDPVDRFCGSFRLFSPDGSPIAHERCWMALALHEEKEYNEALKIFLATRTLEKEIPFAKAVDLSFVRKAQQKA